VTTSGPSGVQDSVPPTDESLVRRLQSGEPDAAAALYARYATRLRAIARAGMSPALAARLESEDLVQSVFRRFFRATGEGRYRLPTGQDLGNLLVAILRNRLKSAEVFHRAAKRDVRKTVGGDAVDRIPRDARAGSDADEGLEDLAVAEILACLPQPHRDVVAQRLDGFEVAEIAGRLGRSKRTVERILQEARGRLQLHFEVSDDDGRPPSAPA
jgi:RNA polymerase sigma-70 factor (ECF subfamily)